jgi:nitrogen fixation protein FixH
MAEKAFTGSDQSHSREVTGRMVLVCLVGFFAAAFAVNGVMAVAAISTFSGLDADSPYQAGLAFDQEIADSRAQQALHWQVQARVTKTDGRKTLIEISAQDVQGNPVAGLGAAATLVHPTDRRLDRHLTLTQEAPGRFSGMTGTAIGQWDVVVDLSRAGTRLFRTKNRVFLR